MKKFIIPIAAICLILLIFFIWDTFQKNEDKIITNQSDITNNNNNNSNTNNKELKTIEIGSDKRMKKIERDLNSNALKIVSLRNNLNEYVDAFTLKHKQFKEDPSRIFQEEVKLLAKIKNGLHEEEHLWEDRKVILQKLKDYKDTLDDEILKKKSEELYEIDKGFIGNDLKAMKNVLSLIETQIESDRELLQYLKKESKEDQLKEKDSLNFTQSTFKQLFDNYEWDWSFSEEMGISNVMPLPNSFEFKERDQLIPIFSLDKDESLLHLESTQWEILNSAYKRFQQNLAKLKYTMNKIDVDKMWKISEPKKITLKMEIEKEILLPKSEDDESYNLEIKDSQILITAKTSTGAIRAFSTLKHLVVVGNKKSDKFSHLYLRPCVISDAPRFSWRGVMIDSARHFQSISGIKRTIDGMELAKLNVLHWHLSDDQGFRFESLKYPLLQEKSSNGEYYKQSEIKEVVEYAIQRGIRIVPEIDVPGHTIAILYAYPELTAGTPPPQVSIQFGTRVDDRAMDISKEQVYTFLENLFGEVAQVFPDEFFHIGGDEVTHKAWNDGTFLSWGSSNGMYSIHDMQLHFNKKLFTILEKLKKVPVGWDEILHNSLPKHAVIQSWRGPQGLSMANSLGFHSILSSDYYLDHMKSSSGHYSFSFSSGLVFGGEACAWSEYIHHSMLDMILWPRLLTISERFWSKEQVNDMRDMYRRQGYSSNLLRLVGVEHLTQRSNKVKEFFDAKIKGHADVEDQDKLIDDIYFVTALLKPEGRVNQCLTTAIDTLNDLIDCTVPESYEYLAFSSLLESWILESSSSGEQKWWKIKNYKSDWLKRTLDLWVSSANNVKAVFSKIPHLRQFHALVESIEKISSFGRSIFDAESKSDLQTQFSSIEGSHNLQISLVSHLTYHPIRKFYDLIR